jgi:hypothetical protein
MNISSFMLMLLRCQLRAKDFQLRAEDFQHSVDVDDAPAFVLKISSIVLMLMMLQPSCCDVVVVDVVSALCCY